jgi:ADP-heptose:LPS heptosyltransferase
MIFEDFKLLAPDAEIDFVCPWQYHDAVRDHPFLNRVLGTEEYDQEDYLLCYNTTSACGRYEMRMAPHSGEHRSDIWAQHCGVHLTRHNMHFQLTDEEKIDGIRLIEQYRFCDGPAVVLAPISAMEKKNIPDSHMVKVAKGLQERGFYPVALHTTPILPLIKNDIPTICRPKLRQWLGVINQADYIVTVDSAALHCAGGMHKPLVGIFTFVNGLVYTRYYPYVELVQGMCPIGHAGCYNWGACPSVKDPTLPCHASLNADSILQAFDRLSKRFPANSI